MSMKNFSFYHQETGLLAPHVISVMAEDIAINTPPDHIALEGHHDHLSQRVDTATGELIEHRPPAPSTDHEWNAQTRRWQLNAIATERANRATAARIRIAELEASQHRIVREHALGLTGAIARLQAIDDEIFSLRSHL